MFRPRQRLVFVCCLATLPVAVGIGTPDIPEGYAIENPNGTITFRQSYPSRHYKLEFVNDDQTGSEVPQMEFDYAVGNELEAANVPPSLPSPELKVSQPDFSYEDVITLDGSTNDPSSPTLRTSNVETPQLKGNGVDCDSRLRGCNRLRRLKRSGGDFLGDGIEGGGSKGPKIAYFFVSWWRSWRLQPYTVAI